LTELTTQTDLARDLMLADPASAPEVLTELHRRTGATIEAISQITDQQRPAARKTGSS
jgi:hypothetical protein